MKITADKLAQLFHEVCEELSPSFGYEIAKPWDSLPQQTRSLMISTAAVVLSRIPRHEVNVTNPVITRIRYRVSDNNGSLCLMYTWGNTYVPEDGILGHDVEVATIFQTKGEADDAIRRTDRWARKNGLGSHWHADAHKIEEVRD